MKDQGVNLYIHKIFIGVCSYLTRSPTPFDPPYTHCYAIGGPIEEKADAQNLRFYNDPAACGSGTFREDYQVMNPA